MKHFLLLSAFIFSAVFFAGAQKTDPVKKIKLPRGIVMKGNHVTVSGKYFVEKSGDGAQVMYRKRHGGGLGIFASFSCVCSGGQGDCLLSTEGNGLRCSPDDCSNCQLKVTIAGNTPSGIRQ